ncbi:MAG: hypothetical protein QM704_13250 [Anaeromyxobacteraceae bacterium]
MTLTLVFLAIAALAAAAAFALPPAHPRPAARAPAGRRALGAKLRDRGPPHLSVPRPHLHAPRRLSELLAFR